MMRKVLIANRGEIAIRVAYTLREMGIETAAVYTDADEQALHVRLANETHPIRSYLDVEEIIEAAKRAGADSIHPGYGFLSENAALSAACDQANLTFIGPTPDTIRKMGDKLESKRVMQAAGVPVVPNWKGTVPVSEYPVLVKAVGGGGGKGMRLVEHPDDLANALASASREAAAAFKDDRVFVEKYIRQPRHVEFQILGDSAGNCIHVFERECSIQRRHQKIIEETPSSALTPELRTEMGTAAAAAAGAVQYRGAGTVEFILDPTGRFYFLEMNTRLQVEHPVTEMTTGLDLVREQVRIAAGEKLSYRQADLRQTGHSIECRIYAEVPEEDFRPSTGTIAVYVPPAGPGIRVDPGVAQDSTVSYHFDPMLAKLIVWAPSRRAAIERMKRALDDFVLLGVRTNIEFLRRVISTDDFAAGKIDTGFLEKHTEVFAVAEHVPIEALLIASLHEVPSVGALYERPDGPRSANAVARSLSDRSPLQVIPDVWMSGHWRNS